MSYHSLEEFQDNELNEIPNNPSEARLNLMCRMTELISTLDRSTQLYKKSLEILFDVFKKAERGVIFLSDSSGTNVNLVPPAAVLHRKSENEDEMKLPISKTIFEKCIKEKSCILIDNAMDDEDMSSSSIVLNEINSVLASPMFHNKVLKGVIVIESSSLAAFTEEDQRLLSAISNQLGLSLNAFDTLQDKIREESIRHQLERYTTPELAEKIQAGEHNISLGGEAKVGVVLFSDLVGFTSMSEILGPTGTVERINSILDKMVKCIFKQNGSIDKFGGDSIMAHWNILSKIETPEKYALKTAINMQNQLFRFNRLYLDKSEAPLRMGIGINTGNVIAGNIGTNNRMDFTLIGETVNLASRLESRAAGNCIFVTEEIVRKSKTDILSIKLKNTKFKNVSKAIAVYSVKGIKIKDGYLTCIPITVKINGEYREVKLTLLNDEVAYIETDFFLKEGKITNFKIWLPELHHKVIKNKFTVLRTDMIEPKPKPVYRIKMILGDGFLKDWLQQKCIESDFSGTDISRNPAMS